MKLVRELWQYRELFYFLVWRDVKIRYKQSLLGAAWAIIQPTFTMVIFTLFFGGLAKMPSDGIPYPLFSYAALLPWTYFSGALLLSGNSLVQNASLIRKVYFPRITIPASSVLGGLVDFGIASLVLMGMMAYYRVAPSWSLLLWPVLVAMLLLLALGVGMIFSALNVKYRDIKYALPFLVQVWLFLTPIIYPASLVPPSLRLLAALNPLTGLVEAFRSSLLPDHHINWAALGMSGLVTGVLLVAGWAYFHRTERAFADVI